MITTLTSERPDPLGDQPAIRAAHTRVRAYLREAIRPSIWLDVLRLQVRAARLGVPCPDERDLRNGKGV